MQNEFSVGLMPDTFEEFMDQAFAKNRKGIPEMGQCQISGRVDP